MKCKHGTILHGAKCANCEIEATRYPATLDKITKVAVRRAEKMIAQYRKIDEIGQIPWRSRINWGIGVKNVHFCIDVTA